MNAELDAAKPVYAFVRQYRETHAFAPNAREAYHALGITKREYCRSLRWLVAYGFLQHGRRAEWRLVRLNIRRCECGAELTPDSAVMGVDSGGYVYMRRKCMTCWHEQHAASQRRFARANPGYYTRLNRRLRKQQREADMNRSAQHAQN